MKKGFKNLIKKVILFELWRPKTKTLPRSFQFDEDSKIRIRGYDNYQDYLDHQSEKLNVRLDEIKEYDEVYEQVVFDRYKDLFDFKGKSILCLAARLGGEVRAFKKLGALAIGIDIEPGERNLDVLQGDFHKINFPDEVFDFAFCNAIDHVLDLGSFFSETSRVLKPGGILIAELGQEKPSKYEVIDTQNHEPILAIAEEFFKVKKILEMKNEIGFVNWTGIVYKMEKRLF